MKFNKKQQMLELLETLIEGITYIKNNIESDYTFMSEISLQAIISIKNTLNNAKKCDENLNMLSIKVYNNIIGIHEDCVQNKILACDETIRYLFEMIKIIKDKTNKKLDIVFMPYNAFMWNSLESVWKAASEDKDCNCYVVPIPYYKLISNENGETEEVLTYEGDLLPDYVPVIDYKEFDLKSINPDIIYVHNQYDEHNNATRVFTEYFSYNLKNNTDMLVYITYGILGTYPVSFYIDFYNFISTRSFDRVVVQSPSFEIIAETSGVNKDKILPLGSPKFDALINSLEKQEVSQFYEDKFKDKTVFLWTTNLMKIINGRNNVLDEIEEVFEFIKNNKQYGLIYRPHPLELTYVKSKAPECYQRYNELLEWSKSTENIVVDNTPSYYEAFKVSNALITDRSSVLIEYMATGKPVLIYDIDLEREYYNENVFDIFANYIVGVDDMTVEKFIDLVVNNNDKKRQQRLMALHTVILNSDGSCGKKIHNNTKEDIIENYF
ncbi:CDP-glycerol glycerophosphotransferase family protein [Paraclostridium sordellii]|uniref:CDP-glycerol glycerophosphotransferase family protein n=1 Tax=Paraclostridium sordellii TaxID=1505 RepID=UPI0030D1A455